MSAALGMSATTERHQKQSRTPATVGMPSIAGAIAAAGTAAMK